METIGIIGAGPAGIMTALKASQHGNVVHIFESNNQIGRKLLVTGSGRCNITNSNAKPESYFCSDPSLLKWLFEQFPPERLRKELHLRGILTYATDDGWCYPVSESAANVVDLFTQALSEAGVEIHLNMTISSIHREMNGFKLVSSNHQTFHCDRLVLASGGMAYPALGANGALFSEIKNLGHTVLPILPALAPLEADISKFHNLQGVRFDVNCRLWKKDHLLGESNGNLIVTAWGFNGPAVMNLSHLVSLNAGEDLQIEMDVIPNHKSELKEILTDHKNSSIPVYALLGAILPNKMPKIILQLAKLPPGITCAELDGLSSKQLWDKLTSVRFSVLGTRGFEFCQLKVGGVPLGEIDPKSFRSRICPNLYLVGEVLDVAGPCGGFNLQFAFASGLMAGTSINLD
jgi:predicted Rossmann fold flavoprotein